MNLIIDSGNSKTKIYSKKNNSLELILATDSDSERSIIESLQQISFQNSIFCNVGLSKPELACWLKKNSTFFIHFDQHTKVPIDNYYTTPQTLGFDRLATAIGANTIFAEENILVIDTGTAITYDIVSKGCYLGGAIAPGMHLRFASLHKYTGNLPQVNYQPNYTKPGSNTIDAILNGVVEGIKNEIEGTIHSYNEKYSKLITVITGGDADIFAKKIKNSIFAEPNLLAKGLNRILNYNVEKT